MDLNDRARSLVRGVDPLTPLVGLVAFVAYGLHGFEGGLSRDLGIYSYAGQQFADGVPPYAGIMNRAGPLAHMLPAIGVVGARIGGFDELHGIRVVYLVFAVGCVCVLYLLGRELFRSRLVGLVAAATFLMFSPFMSLAANGPRDKMPMTLFLLSCLLAIVHRRWLTAGVFLSLATLVLQIAFFPGAAAMLVMLFALRGRELLVAVGRFVGGGLIPVAIMLVYFAAAGALTELLDGFLRANLRYTRANPLSKKWEKVWDMVSGAYGPAIWVVLAGLLLLVILSLQALRPSSRRQNPMLVPLAALGAGEVAAIVWSLRDFDATPDTLFLLPYAALGVAGALHLVASWLPARFGIALLLTWAVACTAIAFEYAVTERPDTLVRQRTAVDAVLDQLPADATILSVEAPQPLVLTGRTNPTRHQTLAAGLQRFVNDTWPGGLPGYARWIQDNEPTVISMQDWRPPPRWLRPTLRQEYVKIGPAPGWRWYAHNSLDPEVIDALRQAANATR